ncbi:CHASE domain-containing protein [Leptolyngbya sp. FACHB-261]|uniref:CHASE domain-containing sensor histidine kinase n=1 Tax=Leptolyngbya sp. FACHB-261 TaxID=2692806 RepID=UPI00168487ED|nr:CHASE domain-containing protein [Leptolyngbya sp. FACHB-261]MBD2104553.1 CHASE domain-containing protein [Leptolyngbya sp. FACHB-261]
MKTELQERADILAVNLQRSVDACLEVLRSISQFYASSKQVRRQDFKSFVQPTLSRHPSIYALEWLPRIRDSERSGLEQAVQAEGYPVFEITERTAEGKALRATQRSEYFPVLYVEPFTENRPALGFDLASDPTRWSAMQKARDTGSTVASGRIKLVQETHATFGFLVILPIYQSGVVPESLAMRPEALQGFVIGVFRIADIVKAALPGLDLDQINLYLYDKSGRTGQGFLAYYEAETKQILSNPQYERNIEAAGESLYRNRNICTRNFQVTDRQWSLLALPTSDYVDRAELYNQSRMTADTATAQAQQLRQALYSLHQTQGRWFFEKKLIAGAVGLVLLILCSISFVSYRSMTLLIKSTEHVESSHQMLVSLAKILFIVSGNEADRIGRPAEQQALRQEVETLQKLTTDAQTQQRLADLQVLIARSGEPLASPEPSFQAELQREVVALQQAEQSRLQAARGAAEASVRDTVVVDMIGVCLCFALLVGIYYLLHRQITERSSAEAALCLANDELETRIQEQTAELDSTREISDLKLRFFSMASHEFRTPLSIILVSVQGLENNSHEWTEERKHRNFRRIRSAARMMAQLLSDILTLTRAEVGKLEYRPELLNLDQFCQRLIEEVQLSRHGYGEGHSGNGSAERSIRFTNHSGCIQAYLDEKLLHSILTNLLSNALKYSAPESQIHLELTHGENIIFKVRDQGIGIPPEDQQQLYEAFYRGQNVGDITGTGLGLAVVKTCVDLHGGQISFESKVGLGTTFTLTLPQRS